MTIEDDSVTGMDLPGMWTQADFLGGDPDERSHAEREAQDVHPAFGHMSIQPSSGVEMLMAEDRWLELSNSSPAGEHIGAFLRESPGIEQVVLHAKGGTITLRPIQPKE